MSRQTFAATAPLSPVMILTVDAEARRARAIDGAGVGLRPVDEGRGSRRAAGRARRPRVGAVEAAGAARVATATTRAPSREEALEGRARSAAGRPRSARAPPPGAPLVTSSAAAVRRGRDDRGQLALVVEGQEPESLVGVGARPATAAAARAASASHEREVERVAARPGPLGRSSPRCTRSPSSERPRGRPRRPGPSASVERDRALGQRAGLVGEQHLDVAEVLDRHQPLDEHALAARARASRSTG